MLGISFLLLSVMTGDVASAWNEFIKVADTNTTLGESVYIYDGIGNITCLIRYAAHPMCTYISYDEERKLCRLHEDNASVIVQPGWSHYYRFISEKCKQNGDACHFSGLHQSCIETNDVCEYDSPAAQRPKCISSKKVIIYTELKVGKSCNDLCTDVNNARCIEGHCYCKRGYAWDETLKICVEYCKTFSATDFDYHEGVVDWLNIGTNPVITQPQLCFDFCNNNHPEYMSIDMSVSERRCTCNAISWHEARNTQNTKNQPGYVNYDRKCEIFP